MAEKSRLNDATSEKEVADQDVEDDEEGTDVEEEEEHVVFTRPSCSKRTVKTLCMTLSMAGMGMYSAIMSPTVLDMSRLLGVTYADLGRAMTASSVGKVIIALAGGLMYDRFRPRSDVLMFVGSMLLGLSTAFMPWSPHLYVLNILMVVSGAGIALLNTGVLTLIPAMWTKHSSVPLHLVFAAVTVGLMVTPMICAPFLAATPERNNVTAETGNATSMNSTFDTNVHYAYVIVGGLNILFGLPYLVFALSCPVLYTSSEEDEKQKKKPLWKLLLPSAYRPDKPVFAAIFLIFVLAGYVFMMMTMACTNFIQFLFSVEVIKLNKLLSSKLLTIVYGVEVLSRLFVSALSHFISIQVIFMAELVGGLIFTSLIAIFGFMGPWHYWGLFYAFQAFFGPLMATVTSWTNAYVAYTGIVCSLFQLTGAIGMGLGFGITGMIYDNYGSHLVLYFMLGAVAIMCLLIFPLQMLAHRAGERFDKPEHSDIKQ